MRSTLTRTNSAPLTRDWLTSGAAIRLATLLHWALRLSVAWEFIGHGLVGTSRPKAWLPYFHLFGFNNDFAHTMMPSIGSWDIAVGLLVLVLPLRALLVWTTVWGVFTALLRPLAGQGWWEFVERGGNYGPPLAFLLLSTVGVDWRSPRTWLTPASTRPLLSRALAQRLQWLLRVSVALLLIGHGGIGVFNQPGWATYFHLFGISKTTVQADSLITVVGWCEIALGLAVLLKPFPGLLVAVLVWKVFSEVLRPIAGEHVGQFMERGGDYWGTIALFLVLTYLKRLASAEAPALAEASLPSAVPRRAGSAGSVSPP